MKKITLLILITILTSFTESNIAHQDFYVIKDYDNIRTRIKTGLQYEEIKKIEFVGKYAKLLAKELNYKEKIFLDFDHFYVSNCDTDYFISFDKGRIKRKGWDKNEVTPGVLENEALVIRQVGRIFDIALTLKLLEYSIKNYKKIKSTQKLIYYNKNYNEWQVNTIDTVTINSILKRKKSDLIWEVLNTKFYRKSDNSSTFELTYYTKNNKYYIDYFQQRKLMTLELDNIYDFQRVDKYSVLVFDTDSSFYYLTRRNIKTKVKKNNLDNTSDYFKPMNVVNIGYNKVAIYFYPDTINQRTVIYDVETGKLIQDLDTLFEYKK
ncbi:MAG: hypothetical protein JXQ93_05985 [Flavobacteriaceae bacterium]